MKTATVTWITYNNYGTLLQAYALQKKIEQLGYENAILSDKEILKEYQADKRIVKSQEKTVVQSEWETSNLWKRIVNILTNPRKLRRSVLARTDQSRYAYPYEASQRMCSSFKRKNLKIFHRVDTENLSDLNHFFDMFVAGSDQVWSVFDRDFNPYYYLDFVTKKKLSYAPSLGTDQIPKDMEEQIRKLLVDYAAVSVRENVSARQLSQLTGQNIEWVVDPTLLYDQYSWGKFTAGISVGKKKYLLCYFLENKPWYFEYARKLAKKLHLYILLIPTRWEFLISEYVIENGVGPKEFVSLIQHANYVLTDSYHGSIFSLIFERQFQYLRRFSDEDLYSQNIRVRSLFDHLGLMERIVTEQSFVSPRNCIDYEIVRPKIEAFRHISEEYLKESLEKEVE